MILLLIFVYFKNITANFLKIYLYNLNIYIKLNLALFLNLIK